jgi:transposase
MKLNRYRNPAHGRTSVTRRYMFAFGVVFTLTDGATLAECGINIFTHMPHNSDPEAKRQALQASGTFNPRHARVRHALFQQSDFFDPRDLLQLKYETLRALQTGDYSIAQAAGEFGLSRPTIYQAQSQFQARGLEGLLPHKRGPKNPHKLTAEVRRHLQEIAVAQPELGAPELTRRLRQRFKVKLHPRTVEKALNSKAKRGRQTSP